MNHFIDFTDRVCLITGAGNRNGIGFETARLLGELGGIVLVCATTDRIHQRAGELLEMGIRAEGFIADLTDRAQVKELVDRVIQSYDRIDVLVNNAGMIQVGQDPEEDSSFENTSFKSWDESIARTLTTCFNVTHEVLPYMLARHYGRIVNTSSVTGPIVSNPGSAAYGTAKAGIIGMSRSIAIETAKENIMVNNVLPGWIATASQEPAEVYGGQNTPAGRSGTAEEVANMNVFLASERASYITGQTFIVDGGNTIQEYKGPSDLYY